MELITPRLGATVNTPVGPGVVTDRDRAYGEALIKLESGSELDTSHGQWWPISDLTVTGYDPDAMVWRGARFERAGER